MIIDAEQHIVVNHVKERLNVMKQWDVAIVRKASALKVKSPTANRRRAVKRVKPKKSAKVSSKT